MKILVLNAGSGSQRCSLFDLPDGELPEEPMEPVWEAHLDTGAPGQPEGKLVANVNRAGEKFAVGLFDAKDSADKHLRSLLHLLLRGSCAGVSRPGEIDAVAHRVVHGGAEFDQATRVDAAVEAAIERYGAIAPLHNPNNLAGIRVAREVLGKARPQIAVFDTAFHQTMSTAAVGYASQHEGHGQGSCQCGFHGISFRYACERAAWLLADRRAAENLRLIICHLGGGSLCATVGGRSIDTTMLREGIAMSESDGTSRAQDIFIHGLRAGIGHMIASLGDRPDALVFTDASDVDRPTLRAAACHPFAFLDLQLDPERNGKGAMDSDLATSTSAVRALLIQSREAWQIARESHAVMSR